MSIGISEQGYIRYIRYISGPLACHTFFNRITTFGETTSRYLFHQEENAASFAKIIIICENNFSC